MLPRERLLHHIQAPLKIAVAQERPPVAVGETAAALQPGADNTPTNARSPMACQVSQWPRRRFVAVTGRVLEMPSDGHAELSGGRQRDYLA